MQTRRRTILAKHKGIEALAFTQPWPRCLARPVRRHGTGGTVEQKGGSRIFLLKDTARRKSRRRTASFVEELYNGLDGDGSPSKGDSHDVHLCRHAGTQKRVQLLAWQ